MLPYLAVRIISVCFPTAKQHIGGLCEESVIILLSPFAHNVSGGDSTAGAAYFANLRRLQAFALMPKEIRCYFLSKEGSPKRFQCTIARQGQRWYAEMSELNVDVPIFKTPEEGGPGTTTHAYLGFALNGPVAVFRRPMEKSMLLA